MGHQHDIAVVTQLCESRFQFFYAVLYAVFVYGLLVGIQLASSESSAVICDQRCTGNITDQLCNVRPNGSVVSSTGLEQNWYPTSFQNVKMQTITAHVDEDVGFLGSGRTCHRRENDNYHEEESFHGRVYTKCERSSQQSGRNCSKIGDDANWR